MNIADKIIQAVRNFFTPLFAAHTDELLCVFGSKSSAIIVARRGDALFFVYEANGILHKDASPIKLLSARGKAEKVALCKDFYAFESSGEWHISYLRPLRKTFKRVVAKQNEKDQYTWREDRKINTPLEHILDNLTTRGHDQDPNREEYFFDHSGVDVIGMCEIDNGMLAIYQSPCSEGTCIGAALFQSRDNSWREIWRCELPLKVIEIPRNTHPIGAFGFENMVHIFWKGTHGALFSSTVHNPFKDLKEPNSGAILKRSSENPILAPKLKNSWEAVATLNPAAVLIDGYVHLLYRAIGTNGQSVWGHAASPDGLHFARRAQPAYVPRSTGEGVGVPHEKKTYDYRSPLWGPGSDGAEDPRATVYEGRVHVMYAAFNGCGQARTAGTSISVNDFVHGNFHRWNYPTLLSAPPTRWGTGGKNAALMPAKKDGKYIIFHRVWPNICIDYTDSGDLSEYGKPDRWLEVKDRISIRSSYWDSGKICVGAPPIETPDGWLLLYTGVSTQDRDGGYKMGAMILDKDDPSKVLYRTTYPVMVAKESYECEGITPNIVYPCGAVIKDETLLVYYGGADTYVCVASANLRDFLDAIKQDDNLEVNVKKYVLH